MIHLQEISNGKQVRQTDISKVKKVANISFAKMSGTCKK